MDVSHYHPLLTWIKKWWSVMDGDVFIIWQGNRICYTHRSIKVKSFLPIFFSFGSFMNWCIARLLNFYLPVLFSEDAQWGWKEEVLVTRVGKWTLVQATKDLRVESQVLYVVISVSQWVEWLSCHFVGSNPWTHWVFLILTYRMEPFSLSGICHHSPVISWSWDTGLREIPVEVYVTWLLW